MMPFDPLRSDAPWNQRWTLAGDAIVSGIGVHTGAAVTLTMRPAPAGHGVVFRRVDLEGSPCVYATPESVHSGHMATLLVGEAGARVSTVEHVLAALWGLGVSDAILELDGPEAPIGDGSSLPFVLAICAVGVKALAAPRPFFDLPAAGVMLGDRSVSVVPGDTPSVTVVCDYGRVPAGPMLFTADLTPAVFARDIAPARTFALEEDITAILSAGLGLGASLDCAVVVGPTEFSVPLRFPDELVRHKALDLIGDLALLGTWWRGRVIAIKAGHSLHTTLARRLAAAVPEGTPV